MSLPPGFLDELRSRASLSQVVGRKVMWDTRKSNQGKGDMWAPCPFHQEKTASFHVDDRKGFYYCFGCHAKGDAIGFIKDTENVSFMEAVEILAREVGMPMPARDPRAQEKADKRTQLAEVMEQAVQFFRLQLNTGAAGPARSYLDRRGLDKSTLERWEIGFAPDGWQGLWNHLRGKNVAEDLILGAGLAKPSSKGGKPYDTFRNRIMFPIRDARGRCIAFGGRAMDPDDNAKYLNSPETELFDKGRSLYNHGPAREAAGKGKPLIVAEGYMDVIALHGGGFEAAVAPLGTAITENQLQLLWRIAPEPIIALDGDTAGLRAAMRLIDLALPLLEAGQSLRFALMPEGLDPDDLIRAQGAGAVQKLLDQAIPMVRLLWQRETDGKVFDSPERKAALDKVLREKIKLIRDPSIRSHYGQEIKNLRWQLFNPRRQSSRTPWVPGRKPILPATPGTRNSMLAAAGDRTENHLREAIVLAGLIATPQVISEFETGIERMECADPDFARMRDVILRNGGMSPDTLAEEIRAALGGDALENLHAIGHVAISPCVLHPGDVERARLAVDLGLKRIAAYRGHVEQLEEVAQQPDGAIDETDTWRLGDAAKERIRAERDMGSDDVEFVVADNGARLDKRQVDESRAILDSIDFTKGGRAKRQQ
ncbi:DNA primase [Arenibacterium sp. CAU 1754]